MTAAEFAPDGDTEENRIAIKNIAARARSIWATDLNSLKDMPSPCISVCRVDADSGWCEGCLRTLDEIAAWGGLGNDAKRGVWRIIEQRAAVSLAVFNPSTGEAP
jgi:uncharacterized protein